MIEIAIALLVLVSLSSSILIVARSTVSRGQVPSLLRALFLSIPLLILLTPGFGSAPAVRIEEILLFLLAPFIIAHRPPHKVAKLELLFLLYSLGVLVSIFMGYLLDGSLFFRDFFELVRVAKYWLLVRLALSLGWSDESAASALRLFLWVGLLAVGIAFAQSTNAFNINSIYTPLFIKDFRLATVHYQVTGTIQNYNLYGTFLAMAASVAVGVLLFARGPRKEKALSLAVVTALLLAVTRTTSKGAFLALVIAAASLWLLRLILVRDRRLAYSAFLFVALATIVLVGQQVLMSAQSVATVDPVQALASRFQPEVIERSYEIRRSDWQLALELASKSLVFGAGPSKDEQVRTFHSEYLTHLRRYGLFGLGIYLLLLGGSALSLLRLMRAQEFRDSRYGRALFAGALGALAVFIFASLVYQVFQQLQLAALMWWLLGAAFAYAAANQQETESSWRESRT
jgi:O-antigen ligase